MKNRYLKFLLLLGFSGLLTADVVAQKRGGEARNNGGGQRNISQPNNSQPRVQSQRQDNSSFNRPQHNVDNAVRTRPTTQQPQVANQTPRAVRDNPRPVRQNPQATTNSNQPAPRTVNPTPAVSQPRTLIPGNASSNPRLFNDNATASNTPRAPRNNPATAATNNAARTPGTNTARRPASLVQGRRPVVSNYYGNNYYSHNYYNYNNRPRVVYNAYNPSWRYNYYPRRNTIVTSFPFAYTTINYGGYPYRYYDGLWYRPYNSYYRVIAPPIGIYINTLPFGYSRIYVRNNPYYYYNGTYYDQYESNYRVVAPPVGAVVESIPEGYETVVIDGETYYKVDGVQYKPFVKESGEIWYEVIKVDL